MNKKQLQEIEDYRNGAIYYTKKEATIHRNANNYIRNLLNKKKVNL